MQRPAASGIAAAEGTAAGSARGAAFSEITAGLSVVDVGAGSGGVRLHAALATLATKAALVSAKDTDFMKADSRTADKKRHRVRARGG